MGVGIHSRYAAEKLSAAYDILASLTVPAPRRLAGALWEISMLRQHNDQFTDRGRELYEQLMRRMEGNGSFEDRANLMSEEDLIDVGNIIRDLFHDTLSHYHGVD